MSIPQINNGKRPSEHLRANLLWALPNNTPFGNLTLKSLKIILRIDHINLRVEEAYNLFSDQKDVSKHLYVCEEIVYWLRVTADELTMLGEYLSQSIRLGELPDAIQLDSVGKLIGERAAGDMFAEHVKESFPFLITLNDVSNAFKHSFINSDQSLIGVEEPRVFALSLPYNILSKGHKLYEVKLRNLVLEFSTFFELCRDFILATNKRLPEEIRTSPGAAQK